MSTIPAPLRWGPWHYRPGSLTLEYGRRGRYFVRLTDCTTSARALDWIAQVAGKPWCTDSDLGHLVRGLNDLLRFQGRLCGSGRDHQVDAAKLPQMIDQAARAKRAAVRWKAERAVSEPGIASAAGIEIRSFSDARFNRLAEIRREEGLA